MITLNSQIERSNGLLVSGVDNETVILDTENGHYHGLNPMATQIWSLLESSVTVQSLCESLVNQYDVSSQQCEQDVLTFLSDLLTRDVIRVAELSDG